jgi:hypothetical protein
MGREVPDFAEPVIGPAEGRTRWLNPGYARSFNAVALPEGCNLFVGRNATLQRFIECGSYRSKHRRRSDATPAMTAPSVSI